MFLASIRHWITNSLLMLAVVMWFFEGCGTLVGSPEDEPDPSDSRKAGTVRIELVDAPADEVSQVWITVERVSLQKEGDNALDAGWHDLPLTQSQEIDLLTLADGVALPLTEAQLPAGKYSSLRFVLSELELPRVVESSGEEHFLKVPSSSVNVAIDFKVVSGEVSDLTIDFDVRQSLIVAGRQNAHSGTLRERGKSAYSEKYILRPVLRVLESKKMAQLRGRATGGLVACMFTTGQQKSLASDCAGSVGSAKVKKSGDFAVRHLSAGVYELRVFESDGSYTDYGPFEFDESETKDVGDLDIIEE